MKKSVLTAVVCILTVSFLFYGCNKTGGIGKPLISNSSTAEEVVDFYADAVKNSKNSRNFNLDVVTTIKLLSIDSSAVILKDVLESVMGYKVGDSRQSRENFSFSGGTDVSDASKTPLNVIQPAGTYIETFNSASVKVKAVDGIKAYSLSFETAKESAPLDTVMNAIRPILKGEQPADKTAIFNLAPVHSAFIEVGDILSTAVDILGISSMMNMGNGNSQKNGSASGSNQAIRIEKGVCSIDTMEIRAEIDENRLLKSVTVIAPVELNADIYFMGNMVNTTIRVHVLQKYAFSNYEQ